MESNPLNFQRMKNTTRALILLAGVLLLISIFVPIWRIDLDAPQYPEGLSLLIYSYKLAGSVDIINGLNHYIGMKTLQANDFIEFTVLPYIIGVYALFAIIVSIIKSRKLLNILFFAFVVFGIVAMIDFWRWEYDYGHNLNPDAAIIVPGMAYQPPLIGFKQLLNFGAYSIPDIGGLLFIIAGIAMLIGVWIEQKNKIKLRKSSLILIATCLIISSCNSEEPNAIKFNVDNCENCKMSISDPKFACEFKTAKGRSYKFDDLICMKEFCEEKSNNNIKQDIKNFYVAEFSNNNSLTKIQELTILKSESIKSPMGGGFAAFKSLDSAIYYKEKYTAVILKGDEIFKNH